MILKCGQKDNKNYTFGVRKEQIEEAKEASTVCCASCGNCFSSKVKQCPHCGKKL